MAIKLSDSIKMAIKLSDSLKFRLKQLLRYLLGGVGLLIYVVLLGKLDLSNEDFMAGVCIGFGICLGLVVVDIFFITKNSIKELKR
jgi:hypothetical protein